MPAPASASSPPHDTATCTATTGPKRSWQPAPRTAAPASSRSAPSTAPSWRGPSPPRGGDKDALLLAHPRGSASQAGDFTGAAATRALNSFTAALGLKHADLAPASAARWRVQHIRDTQGFDAAVEIAGTSKAAVESELGITRELKPTKVAKARGSQAAF